MKTFVEIQVSSEGSPASEITEILLDFGFSTSMGQHDFVYDWGGKDITPAEVITFVDRVQARLKGKNVGLHFTTLR